MSLKHCKYCNKPTLKTYAVEYSISYSNEGRSEYSDFSEDCFDLCPKCFKKLMKGKISIKQLRRKRTKELKMVDKIYDHLNRKIETVYNNYSTFHVKSQDDLEKGGDKNGNKENRA